ncbi:MAG: 2-oxoglutarate dehydrogenase E1 subunit family protein, partial [Microthrixaceae bacterium]
MADEHPPEPLGPNAWLVEEMHEQYTSDPSSVSESWREFFADYRPGVPSRAAAATSAPAP